MASEKRLADVNALLEEIDRTVDIMGRRGDRISVRNVIMCVKNAPTVDAVEVVHAQWLDGSGMSRDGSIVYESIDCSHCEEVFKIESRTREYWKERFKVCPFCGAKMDGGNE